MVLHRNDAVADVFDARGRARRTRPYASYTTTIMMMLVMMIGTPLVMNVVTLADGAYTHNDDPRIPHPGCVLRSRSRGICPGKPMNEVYTDYQADIMNPVSYTHLTLPTILRV